jgi:hypothetical protein
MTVYEAREESGPVRLAIGSPETKLDLYGRERRWVSVWHVLNDRPVRQLANFLEADGFDVTGEPGRTHKRQGRQAKNELRPRR